MRRLVRAALLAPLAGVLLLAGAPSYAATTPGPGWIVGDSITVQSSPGFLAAEPPEQPTATAWTVDGKNGRHLYQLPALVKARLATGQRTGTMVLALGTNDRWPGETTPTLTRTQYVRAVDSIPRTVKVVLVTPYRHAPVVGTWQANRMAEITRWQKDLDKYRPNVTIASYRYRIEKDGAARYLLADGVHPHDAGRVMWTEQVRRAVVSGT